MAATSPPMSRFSAAVNASTSAPECMLSSWKTNFLANLRETERREATSKGAEREGEGPHRPRGAS